MCSLTAAAIALTAAAAAGSAYGSYQQQKAANKAADYNAQILEENAAVSESLAASATDRGDIAGKQKRLQIKGLIGKQRSASAASGVLVGSGSSLDAIESTDTLGEQDILTIRDNAALEAYGYKSQAQSARREAYFLRKSKRDPFKTALPSLLTGSANTASVYAYTRKK